jgi:hypothetical protein
MKPLTLIFAFLLAVIAAPVLANAQDHGAGSTTRPQSQAPTTPQQQTTRDATREKMRALLEAAAPKININFRLSDKQPYNFVGVLKTGLKNADALEIVISVSAQDTIHFRIFPHYKESYVNIDKVVSGTGLMRQMARFSDQNFLFWGMDGSSDIFAGYNFTLESGFPDAAINVVLRSIANVDQFIGQMRPSIDGSAAQ